METSSFVRRGRRFTNNKVDAPPPASASTTAAAAPTSDAGDHAGVVRSSHEAPAAGHGEEQRQSHTSAAAAVRRGGAVQAWLWLESALLSKLEPESAYIAFNMNLTFSSLHSYTAAPQARPPLPPRTALRARARVSTG